MTTGFSGSAPELSGRHGVSRFLVEKDFVEFMRRLPKVKLEPWQLEIIQRLKGGFRVSIFRGRRRT